MRDEPSSTARFVAEHIILLGSRTHALLEIPSDQIEWMTRILEAGGWSRGALSPLRSALVERFSIPGIRTHYVLRKKIIEREVRQAIDEGCQQVVIIGAGFDVLAFRLAAEFPSVAFREIDHPATQRAKRAVGERFQSRVEFVAADLRNLPIDIPMDREKKTVFVVEGVLMYFGRAEVIGILQWLRSAADNGRLIATAMAGERFDSSTRLAQWWLKRKGEAFRSAVAPNAVAPLLAPIGLKVVRMYGAQEIRAELPARAGRRRVAAGEFIVVAEW